ncbi:MAG: amidohydrolase [Marinisporobacter sp.]|jgi:amidohydrolase|nr:amidohydrolase [Marinisporobacter sp.]
MEKEHKREFTEKIYDYLHTIPEIGFKEFKTSTFIASELRKYGYEVIEKISGTGIVAILDSKLPGPNIAVRADMDALTFEKDGEKCNIHACGHDANSAMVLTAAKEIKKIGINNGKLFIIFQPAEEILGGAQSIIESGYIDEVEEMIGIHLRPIQEARLGEATPALVHGSSYRMIAKIKGLNAHGARPHLGVNAVDAAVLVVNAINAIRLDPRVSHSIKVTKLHAGGEATNIIPDEAEITMDMRAQNNEVMEEMIQKAKGAIISSAKAIGAQGNIEFVGGVPAAEYDDEMINIAKTAIEEELESAMEPLYTTGGEDFHFYTKELNIKTAYIGLGADLTPGLHHPKMKFDKKALGFGVNILKNIILKRLG